MEHRLAKHRPVELPSTNRAAVALILRPHGEREVANLLELLLIRRADHPEDPWSGHMGLPGGHVDNGDADPLAAATRETREEVSIDLAKQGRCIGKLADRLVIRGASPTPPSLVITPFVFLVKPRTAPQPNEEIAEIHWITLRDFLKTEAQAAYSHDDGQRQLEFPAYRVNQRIVWGVTYRMLRSLFVALGTEHPALCVKSPSAVPPSRGRVA